MPVEQPFDLADDVEAVPVDDLLERDRWLELREQGIGGSDASAIIGFNRWTSPRKVWLDKTWRRLGLPQIPDEASEAARWGTRLESVVADAFAEKTGLAVVDPKFMYVQRQAGRAPRVHNPDRAVYDPDLGAWVPLEIKTCSQYGASDWDDGPAGHAYTQIHHYDAGLRTGVAWAAVLIGGQDFRVMRVEIDRAFQDDVAAVEDAFWFDYVEPLVEPPAEAVDDDALTAARIRFEETVDLPSEARDLWAAIVDSKTVIADATDVLDSARGRLKQLLGDYQTGMLDGVKVCGWTKKPDPDAATLYLPAAAQAELAAVAPRWWAAHAVPRKQVRQFRVNSDWSPATPFV